MGAIPAQEQVLKARRLNEAPEAPWVPCPLDQVLEAIARERPAVVFAPHVETAAGMRLPDAYLQAVGQAVHEVAACSCSTASLPVRSGSICRSAKSIC